MFYSKRHALCALLVFFSFLNDKSSLCLNQLSIHSIDISDWHNHFDRLSDFV
jgi:hypothetical protein